MQLTKDDVFKGDNLSKSCFPEDVIPLTKFQQVVEFYKRYYRAPTALQEQHPEIYKKYKNVISNEKEITFVRHHQIYQFENWLFDYCFVEGLK